MDALLARIRNDDMSVATLRRACIVLAECATDMADRVSPSDAQADLRSHAAHFQRWLDDHQYAGKRRPRQQLRMRWPILTTCRGGYFSRRLFGAPRWQWRGV